MPAETRETGKSPPLNNHAYVESFLNSKCPLSVQLVRIEDCLHRVEFSLQRFMKRRLASHFQYLGRIPPTESEKENGITKDRYRYKNLELVLVQHEENWYWFLLECIWPTVPDQLMMASLFDGIGALWHMKDVEVGYKLFFDDLSQLPELLKLFRKHIALMTCPQDRIRFCGRRRDAQNLARTSLKGCNKRKRVRFGFNLRREKSVLLYGVERPGAPRVLDPAAVCYPGRPKSWPPAKGASTIRSC